MTVWAEGPADEAENDEDNRVQIEIGIDETDIWLAFNRSTSAVQFTHDEALRLIKDMCAALMEYRPLEG